ncbi:hypothetical protein NLI96_g5348 [Meripilus lineatus]|uniref:Uncharacterized protein n=1 Tax=Meripilus lineatus TaxID=2056292 RepID=A0AAD5YJ29_9APHY|nr:hypothetical protein NLI96_g5348 [Physisporinus lineatus]
MDPSQDPSQDISQDLPQENIPFPYPVAVKPHEILNPIPSSPLSPPSPSSSSSSTPSPPSPSPLLSPPPSSIASSLNADPSSSVVHPQSHAVTHFAQNLLYYLPSPAGQSIRPRWNLETGFPGEIWQPILEILCKSRSALALLACALTCTYLRKPAQQLINRLLWRTIRAWTYEDIDLLVEDVCNAPRDVTLVRQVQFIPEERDDKSAGSAVALSVAPLRLAGQRALRRVDFLSLGNALSDPTIRAHFHPRSCPLYGHAFPNTTQIEFNRFQFDSFMEFVFLVTSFPALTSLKLWSLQKFTMWLDSEARRSQGDFANDSWLSAFEPGSPIAQTVELWELEESDISMMKSFISHHMSPAQTLDLDSIYPTAEDFHSFSWKMLDILLFSWYMLHGKRNSRKLSLDLQVPQELWDEQQAVKEKTTKDKANMWLHFLFPLNMAVGKGRWLRYCKAERGEY